MRLLFISTNTRPIVGGIANCLDSWLSGLAELGHEVSMLSLLPPEQEGKLEELTPRKYQEEWLVLPQRREWAVERFVPLRKVRSGAYRMHRWLMIRRRFAHLVAAFQPDWVIFSVINPVCCVPLGEVKRQGLRCAGIVYGSEIHPRRVGNPNWLRRTLNQFERIIAISEHTQHMVIDWDVPAERVSIVHPGLTPDFVARYEQKLLHTSSEELPNNGESPRLLTICRLVERKGVQTVLKAIAYLRAELPTLQYDVVGDGLYREELEKLAHDLGMDDIVQFHGLLSDEAREALLRACDIFVMVPFEASDGDVEGFGIVFLEAGLYGKPVIGSRSGGVPDVIKAGQTGILVSSRDVDSMAKAIRDLALNPNCRDHLVAEGKAWSLSHSHRLCGQALALALNPKHDA